VNGGGVGEISDAELVRRVRAGDRQTYGVLVERYQAAIIRRAQAILRDPSAAEDAAQEAFVRAYSYLHTYDDQHRLYTWLARIVTNVCLSHLSSHQWQTLPIETALLVPSETLEDDDPELAALTDERTQELQAAIAGLPSKYREVLILRYWQDLAYDEIADLTAQSLGAVKTQLRRARLMLGDQLRGQSPRYEWGFQR
jgi:RNA polymerase sigma-70 factor (ECF subfamily)